MPRHLRTCAALALAALALTLGCAKRKSVVDPSYTTPEGTFSSELDLITFLDQPTHVIQMVDRGALNQVNITPDPVTTDLIARDANNQPIIRPFYAHGPGTIRGIVLNRTSAEGIEVFRTEPNGSVRRIFDFAIRTTRRWLDGLTELYEFTDTGGGAGAAYLARGLIGGTTGTNSPLSNRSRAQNTPLVNIVYTANRDGTIPNDDGSNPPPADSTFMMRWNPVPGAARYLIQVFEYQPRARSLNEQIATGLPTPLLTVGARDIFVGTVPAAVTTYKLGNAVPGGKIYTFRTPRLLSEYFVRIAALDANSQLIGLTVGPTISGDRDLLFIQNIRDYFANFNDPSIPTLRPGPAYLLYTRAAVRVSPREPREE